MKSLLGCKRYMACAGRAKRRTGTEAGEEFMLERRQPMQIAVGLVPVTEYMVGIFGRPVGRFPAVPLDVDQVSVGVEVARHLHLDGRCLEAGRPEG